MDGIILLGLLTGRLRSLAAKWAITMNQRGEPSASRGRFVPAWVRSSPQYRASLRAGCFSFDIVSC